MYMVFFTFIYSNLHLYPFESAKGLYTFINRKEYQNKQEIELKHKHKKPKSSDLIENYISRCSPPFHLYMSVDLVIFLLVIDHVMYFFLVSLSQYIL